MTDIFSKEQRSRCMASIKGKDTKPEMIVRRYLFSRGLRYRVQVRKLPGTPDIVLPKWRTVVFVDGCFWHGHEGCRFYRMPSSNVDFWEHKISHNKARDIANDAVLQMMGWRVIRVWECEIRKVAGREEYLDALYNLIVTPYAEPQRQRSNTDTPWRRDVRAYDSEIESHSIAAEPGARYDSMEDYHKKTEGDN